MEEIWNADDFHCAATWPGSVGQRPQRAVRIPSRLVATKIFIFAEIGFVFFLSPALRLRPNTARAGRLNGGMLQ